MLRAGTERLKANEASCLKQIGERNAALYIEAYALSGGNGEQQEEEKAESHTTCRSGQERAKLLNRQQYASAHKRLCGFLGSVTQTLPKRI